MKVRFLQDYRGRLTNEVFYTFGTEVDLPNGSDLVAEGRAEAVVVVAPASPKEPVVVESVQKRTKRSTKKKAK